MTKGTLYGIGVGPGDPDLLTMKAVKTLNDIDVVIVPVTAKGRSSKAYEIAKEYLNSTSRIVNLEFPMINLRENNGQLNEKWKSNAKQIALILEGGENAAFLTLGDPMIYSTYSYMIPYLEENGVKPVTIPGITSFCASAALLNIPVSQGNESFAVLTDIKSKEELEDALDRFQDLVIMKASSATSIINQVVKDRSIEDKVYAVTDCGGEYESVAKGLLNENMSYFTLIIIKNNQ
ncbi:precorrin-2 C(20)-methyltransferase [Alkalibacter mobilis]|uniref:precorrin-2 C(20)-methyltransferase n=1 Tax=Alkalibacter mobilis TaxID=2787712 RepID=UPI00189CE006|nr:precorrin-2 C(20)-methyltransferase [Alkalibacter mobilis]MBF7097169.1 precorrin-2 C(20)-methyltransferase [Alkalibacter mobilis]